MGIRKVSLVVFFVFFYHVPLNASTFCDDYTKCMEELEQKQRECLELDRNVKLKSSDECTRKKWDIKVELNALHMRRAELARDCVQKSLGDSQLAESTLTDDTQKQCASLHRKFQFAKSPTETATRKRRSATPATSTQRRRKRDAKRQNAAQECRNVAKAWHKQCAVLAQCCPLVAECRQSTQEIMEQIFVERRKLRRMHDTRCVSL